jgi:hypothetical protein
MNGTADSTITRLALAEVEGKNSAIHAYDQMIWTVRSGFVTLFFGAWALLFQQLLGLQKLSWLHVGVFGALAAFSCVLAAAAYFIERNYVRRKFRVIASLNELMRQLEEETPTVALLAPNLRVAGDTDAGDPDTPGFSSERSVGRYIYGLSLLSLVIGLLLVAAGGLLDQRARAESASSGAAQTATGALDPSRTAK